jgi:hypothetical protein
LLKLADPAAALALDGGTPQALQRELCGNAPAIIVDATISKTARE